MPARARLALLCAAEWRTCCQFAGCCASGGAMLARSERTPQTKPRAGGGTPRRGRATRTEEARPGRARTADAADEQLVAHLYRFPVLFQFLGCAGRSGAKAEWAAPTLEASSRPHAGAAQGSEARLWPGLLAATPRAPAPAAAGRAPSPSRRSRAGACSRSRRCHGLGHVCRRAPSPRMVVALQRRYCSRALLAV